MNDPLGRQLMRGQTREGQDDEGDGLERVGLLQRTRSERDRRTVLVSLTDAGRAALKRKQAQIGRRRRTSYERLEPEERRQSERLLHHLAEIIDQL